MKFMGRQKFSFTFDIYEMRLFTLEQSWEVLKTLIPKWWVFYLRGKKFAKQIDEKEVLR